MRLRGLALIVTSASCAVWAQSAGDLALARELSDSRTRSTAVEEILASHGRVLPLLLSWAAAPPSDVNSYELAIGLADVFGGLKTREAIPFLIRNLGLNRDQRVNLWLKAPEVIERGLPAVAALVNIGAEAASALIRAYWEPMLAEDRPAAIFAITRIVKVLSPTAVPEAPAFLRSATAKLRIESRYAEEGLTYLERKRDDGKR